MLIETWTIPRSASSTPIAFTYRKPPETWRMAFAIRSAIARSLVPRLML